jgi:transposase
MINPWGRRVPDLSKSVLTLEQKTWLAERVINGLETAKELNIKYKISLNTIYRWISLLKSGKKLLTNGRPSVILEEHFEKIEETVNSSAAGISASLFNDEVHKYAILTAQSRINITGSQIKRPSRRTVGKILKRLAIKSGNAEQTTNARAIACSDVRNAVSMCAAQHLMVPLVDHYLILNMDATQYTVGNNVESKQKIFYAPPERGEIPASDQKQS